MSETTPTTPTAPSSQISRTVHRPTTGTKVCLLVALPLLVGAAYFLWMPLGVSGSNGRFGCQSAFNPPSEAFPKNVCGSINELYQLRAGAAALAALLVAGIGALLFGFDSRVEHRTVAPGQADDAAEPDDADEDAQDDAHETPAVTPDSAPRRPGLRGVRRPLGTKDDATS